MAIWFLGADCRGETRRLTTRSRSEKCFELRTDHVYISDLQEKFRMMKKVLNQLLFVNV